MLFQNTTIDPSEIGKDPLTHNITPTTKRPVCDKSTYLHVGRPRGEDDVVRVRVHHKTVRVEPGVVDGAGGLQLVAGDCAVKRLREAPLALLAAAGGLAEGQAPPHRGVLVLALVVLLRLDNRVRHKDQTCGEQTDRQHTPPPFSFLNRSSSQRVRLSTRVARRTSRDPFVL
eukprot:1196420-Prorocentrum_minimum.AAC.2